MAETFSIQLAKGFNPLLNRLRASTGYLYDVSKSCGSLIQCQQNGLRFPSTDHGIKLPMPKLFPLINYLGGELQYSDHKAAYAADVPYGVVYV